ncbi:MAG: TonB-dependent receptor [Bacteroidota bacterium]
MRIAYFPQLLLCLGFLLWSFSSFSQHQTQTIRGNVLETHSNKSLIGVSVYIPKLETGTTSDMDGTFRLEKIPVGRYSLVFSYTGYETFVITEVLLESGKEQVLEVQLKPSPVSLKEIVVKGTVPNWREKIFPPAEVLSLEETLRLPATFFDPARLAFSYAGVVSNSDQANHMIIRGNSPNNMGWRLEGVEIVNPNHLSNAGTNSDRPSVNGGGVNILSAQLLGNSTFMRGAFPVNYGNILSGVMDMNFRKGNDERYEFTGQIGVTGVDLAAEGPLSKKSDASFLVNYRYSTLGLLSAAGVDLGDETQTYQDIAFHTYFPLSKGGRLTFFGFSGTSSNDFDAKEPRAWEIQKDQFNINYTSFTNVIGTKLFYPISDQWNWNLVAAYSSSDTDRDAQLGTAIDSVTLAFQPFTEDELMQRKFSFDTYLNYRLSDRSKLRLGVVNTWIKERQLLTEAFSDASFGGVLEGNFLQTYGNWQYELSRLTLELGARSVFFTFNETTSFDPRASIKWDFGKKQSLGVAYGKESQRQLAQVYFPTAGTTENENLELTKAHHFSLVYQKLWKRNIRLQIEGFYQALFDVPVARSASNSFSVLNIFEVGEIPILENEGTGQNYGVEVTAQQYFYKNWFWLGNVSLYESKYKGSDGTERDTRFNGNYILNATVGKEFPYSKKGKDYILGVNVRTNLAGGLRESPIDVVASAQSQTTVLDDTNAFTVQLDDYFKTDLRIYWKRNKVKFSSTLALDIQNVTNRRNPSFQYFDTFLSRVEREFQLGLIPILSYRIEW